LIDDFKPAIIKVRAIHSKNPFIVRNKPPLMPEEKYKKKSLDGYLMLKLANTELPSEVITIDVSERNINNIEDENFSFFNNLIELNASHNHLRLYPTFSKFENLEVLNL